MGYIGQGRVENYYFVLSFVYTHTTLPTHSTRALSTMKEGYAVVFWVYLRYCFDALIGLVRFCGWVIYVWYRMGSCVCWYSTVIMSLAACVVRRWKGEEEEGKKLAMNE